MGTRDNWGQSPHAEQPGPPVIGMEDLQEPDDEPGHDAAGGWALADELTLGEDEIPEFVFVPSEHPTGGVTGETKVQLRRVEGGGVVLLTYSSLELLVANLGEHQPWIAFPGRKVQELLAETGANAAVLDAPLDPARLEEPDDE